jgi:hypothetical protein
LYADVLFAAMDLLSLPSYELTRRIRWIGQRASYSRWKTRTTSAAWSAWITISPVC